jgi:hypothetical protein
LLLVSAQACAPNLADQASKAPEYNPKGETKCGVAKSQAEPLIVEWPSSARAKLEALSRTGVVAVHYSGCEMEVLASCNAPGKYGYTAITPKHDHVAIRNADDLYANIPLGAARLEGKLERAGELDVDMSIVGRYASDRAVVRSDELQGPDCSKATHVVTALTVGAFDFSAGSSAAVGGGVKTAIGGVGGGGNSQASQELLNSDGTMASCTGAKTTDGKPPDGCGAILRLEVVPLGEAKRDTAVGAAAPPPPPPGAPGAGGATGMSALVGVGGEVELSVPEKEYTFKASVEAGGKTVTCPQDITYYKPCRLSGLPEGSAHVHITGSSTFDREIPVSADGRTTVQILHRGHAQEATLSVFAAAGAVATLVGLTTSCGLQSQCGSTTDPATGAVTSNDNPNFLLNLLLVTIGGSVLLVTAPGGIAGWFTAHDGLLIETPGKASEMARGPHFEWGGPTEPTTFRF